jgi:hypothetical protein
MLPRRRFLTLAGLGAVTLAVGADQFGGIMDGPNPLGSHVTLGAFAANEPWPNCQSHYVLEASLGVKLPIMSWFTTLDAGWLTRQAAEAATSEHELLICLEPVYAQGRAPILFADILAGKMNTKLDRFFAKAAAFTGQVTLRLAHEMNGNWYPWSVSDGSQAVAGPKNATSLDEWLDTWRYIVDRQRAVGGSNIRWNWCVNNVDLHALPAESFWPGADYVDIMSIDGYNGYGPWMSPAQVFQPMYDRLCRLDPDAPIMIAEVGCRPSLSGEPVDKAAWFTSLFDLKTMPRISSVVFFHADKERDWRIDTDDVRTTMTSLVQGAKQAVR